jgi:hypothetical protein
VEITWKFDPDDSEDADTLETYRKATDYRSALCDLSNAIREKIKYANLTEEERKVWEEIRGAFFDIISKYDIDL